MPVVPTSARRALPATFQGIEQQVAQINAWIRNASPKLVSALPAGGIDGQTIFYQNTAMAAAGVAWQLRYRAASSSEYKWEFVGGPPLDTLHEGAINKTTEAVQEITGSPKLVVPVTGAYIIGVSLRFEQEEAATRTLIALVLANGANTGIKTPEYVCSEGGGNFWGATLAGTDHGTLTAGVTLTVGAAQTSTKLVNYQQAYLSLLPVRL